MAAGDARAVPLRSVAYRLTVPVFDADGDLVTGMTGLDAAISIDQATAFYTQNNPVEIATGLGLCYLDLAATEMAGSTIAGRIVLGNAGAKNTPFVIYTATAVGFDEMVNAIWATPTRSVTSVSSPVGVGSNFDKTGYTLTQAAYDQVVSAIWATSVRTLSAQGRAELASAIWASPTRTVTGGTIDTVTTVTTVTSISQGGRAEIASAVWASPTRSLTDWTGIVNAVWATPSRTLTSGAPANVDTTGVIAIASAVWDQARNAKNASGSFGNLVQTFGVTVATVTPGARAEIASTVWASPTKTVTGGTIDTVTTVTTLTSVSAGGRAEIASAVWASPTRSLTDWTGIVNAVWATPVRTITGGIVDLSSVSVTTIASAVWASPTKALTDWNGIVNAVWATPVRTITGGTVTSVASPVAVGSNFDKTGYTLTQAAYDQVVNAIWATPSRTLTSGAAASIDTTAVTAIASGVWDQQRNAKNASGSFGNLVQTFGVTVATNLDKTGYALSESSRAEIASAVWASPSRTVVSVSSPVGVASNYDKGNYTLTTLSWAEGADAFLNRNVAGGSSAGRLVKEALYALRNKVDLTTLTVYSTDDITPAWTFTIATDSANTRLTTVDPA